MDICGKTWGYLSLVRRERREVEDVEDIRVYETDSLHHIAETNITL